MQNRIRVRKPEVRGLRSHVHWKGALGALVVAWSAGLGSPAWAQCGVGGVFSGECVDLEWRNVPASAPVGEIIGLDLYAVSVNSFEQPVQEVQLVLEWDPQMLRLVGRQDPCTDPDACFDCDTLGLPEDTYNWSLSLFPKDDQLDRYNADCGPDTFCSPYTGIPFNDGTAKYLANRQVLCNGQVADPAFATPSGLWVTTIKFEILAEGTSIVSMVPRAECAEHQKRCTVDPFRGASCTDAGDCAESGICLGGSNDGGVCTSDADCPSGECIYEMCIGGSRDGDPCRDDLDCPANPGGNPGFCPVFCQACGPTHCCTTDRSCSVCSFASTRVIGGVSSGIEVTASISDTQVTASSCAVPAAAAVGPRYIDVTPPTGPASVAIYVEGAGANNSCVSGYVLGNGLVGANPVFKPPAGADGWNTVHVRSDLLVSDGTYQVRLDCDSANPGVSFSEGVDVTLWNWADVDDNEVVDISDIVRLLDAFSGRFHTLLCDTDQDCVEPFPVEPYRFCDPDVGRCLWVTMQSADIVGDVNCTPDGVVSIRDIVFALDEFSGKPQPCQDVCP